MFYLSNPKSVTCTYRILSNVMGNGFYSDRKILKTFLSPSTKSRINFMLLISESIRELS